MPPRADGRPATLDDVFLGLTGHPTDDADLSTVDDLRLLDTEEVA